MRYVNIPKFRALTFLVTCFFRVPFLNVEGSSVADRATAKNPGDPASYAHKDGIVRLHKIICC